MSSEPLSLDHVIAAAGEAGLDFRGAFHPREEDGVPAPCGTLVLLGNAGPRMWRRFSEARGLPAEDPLDAWSTRVIGALAERLSARALMPFGGPPWWPFLRWAQRAEPVAPSMLGMTIHPRHGLWHAYRGALAFAETFDLPAPEAAPRPCDDCAERPCLSACPVNAFSEAGYDVAACAAHLSGSEGAECLARGCLARRACPVGPEARYAPEQAAFHMAAFVRSRRPDMP